MFDHLSLGVADLLRSLAFYEYRIEAMCHQSA
jgi:catechol 2,3-dioxygenase-like lactoylglutathione lyase family enzyme